MRRPRQNGNALIEFALGFSLLVPLFAGLFQFGYTFWVYNQLHTAVRAGSRYAATLPYDSSTATPSKAYADAVKNVVVYGAPRGGSTPLLPGLTPANVRIRMQFDQGAPATVVVDIEGLTIPAVFRSYILTGRPRATFRYQGRWAPA